MNKIEARHVRDIAKRTRQISTVIDDTITDISRRFTTVRGKRFATVMTDRLEQLHDQVLTATESGIRNQWMMSNEMNNKGLDGYFANVKIADGLQQSFRAPNVSALNAFIDRRDFGMNLSDRVWDFTNGVKGEMERAISTGVMGGKSAVALSRDLKKYIKGKPIKYGGKLLKGKNLEFQALRIAATEMNMAFRMSDYVQNSKLPFVSSVTVHLSPAHPIYDICNDMAGKYPKGFYFVGWHPLCICYATYDTIPVDDFVKYIKTDKIDKRKFTRAIPGKAQRYIEKNGARFMNYKNTPYWLRDNFTKGLELRKTIHIPFVGDKVAMANPVPVIPTWQPAKTIKEAEQWAVERGAILSDYSGFNTTQTDVINRALSSVPQKAIPDYIGSGRTYNSITGSSVGRKAKDWYGVSRSASGTFPLNVLDRAGIDKFKGLKTLGNRFTILDNTQNVWFSTGYKSFDAIAARKQTINAYYQKTKGHSWFFNTKAGLTPYHEFGHVYYNRVSPQGWKQLSTRWYNETKLGSLSTEREAFAEAFADYFQNKGARLPSYVKKYFDEVIK